MSYEKPTDPPSLTPPTGYSQEELAPFMGEDLETLNTQRLAHTEPTVVSGFLERLELEDRRRVLRKLTASQAADVLSEMDAEASAEVVGAMREWRALKILEDLAPDDAADVFGELDADSRDRLLTKLNPSASVKVRKLLTYGTETAGGVMNPNVPTVRTSMTVDSAIEHIRKLKDEIEHLIYVYVVDEKNHLKGIFSMRDLVMAKPSQHVSDIMSTQLKGVCSIHDDREQVARMMADLNFYALPVIDDKGLLVGIVEHDDVIDILESEATEDLQIMVGAGPDESIHDKITYSIQKRGPWLLVNLLTAFLAAGVVYVFRHQIEKLSILAVFMTVVANLAGNTGAQALAVAIRSLALEEIPDTDQIHVCLKEGLKGLSLGIMIGLCAAVISFLMLGQINVSIVVFVAVILTMALGAFTGAFIPLFLKRFRLDPAQSSSIFLTATTDIVGNLVFLSLGAWLLL